MIPLYLYEIDPKSIAFKKALKTWIRMTIPKDGDGIFKGRVEKEKNFSEEDWLYQELLNWKTKEEHDWKSLQEEHFMGE